MVEEIQTFRLPLEGMKMLLTPSSNILLILFWSTPLSFKKSSILFTKREKAENICISIYDSIQHLFYVFETSDLAKMTPVLFWVFFPLLLLLLSFLLFSHLTIILSKGPRMLELSLISVLGYADNKDMHDLHYWISNLSYVILITFFLLGMTRLRLFIGSN